MPKKNNPFTSPLLKAKVVVDMISYSKTFKEKAEKYDELNTQLEKSVALHHTPEGKKMKQKKLLLKEYLIKHITAFKKDRDAWYYQNDEANETSI